MQEKGSINPSIPIMVKRDQYHLSSLYCTGDSFLAVEITNLTSYQQTVMLEIHWQLVQEQTSTKQKKTVTTKQSQPKQIQLLLRLFETKEYQ